MNNLLVKKAGNIEDNGPGGLPGAIDVGRGLIYNLLGGVQYNKRNIKNKRTGNRSGVDKK